MKHLEEENRHLKECSIWVQETGCLNYPFLWGLMRRISETNYQETLREIGSRAGDMAEEIYGDLQEHKNQLRFIDSVRRNALAKQVRGPYDGCRMAGSSCSHSGECAAMPNLSGFFSNPFSDERTIQNAIRKIKNNSDFFAGECVDPIQKAADWSISFAAGSSEKKRAFLEEIAQGKGKDFLQEVLDSYKSGSGNADMRGKCGYPIGSSEYLDRMEPVVFRQEVPTMCSARWGSPNYDGLLRDALESIAHQLERDLERNERENNYITDETGRNLKAAVSELERCGISTGSASSKIEKLAWFVGGDPAKIRELQSMLNATGMVPHLLKDGAYGEETQKGLGKYVEEFRKSLEKTLLSKEDMDRIRARISIGLAIMNVSTKISPSISSLSIVSEIPKTLYDNRQGIQRFIWKQGAELYLRKNGYDVAALLLEHSLENPAGSLYFSESHWSHWVTEKIMQSNGFQTAYQKLEENIREGPDTYAVPGEIEINFQETGDRDLYLGIGKCTIKYTCTRLDSNVIVHFEIKDLYNFEQIRSFHGDADMIVKFNLGI